MIFVFVLFVVWLTWLSVPQSYVDAVHGSKLLQGNANQAWSCIDLLEVLCQLAERGHASSVRMMLENPLKHCPDVLLAGVAHINVSFYHFHFQFRSLICPLLQAILYCMNKLCFVSLQTAFNLLQYEVSSTVFPLVVGNAMKSSIIHQLWHINPKLVLRGFVNIYNSEPESILRVLDICQELKVKLGVRCQFLYYQIL